MLDLLWAIIKTAFSEDADTDNGRALQTFARLAVAAGLIVVTAIVIVTAWFVWRLPEA